MYVVQYCWQNWALFMTFALVLFLSSVTILGTLEISKNLANQKDIFVFELFLPEMCISSKKQILQYNMRKFVVALLMDQYADLCRIRDKLLEKKTEWKISRKRLECLNFHDIQ